LDSGGAYRGLIAILTELDLIDDSYEPKDLTLAKLREILSTHVSIFEEQNTHLEQLANKYDIKIIWCPKYHCELNPIEGVWCDSKWFVRKNNDQDFRKLNKLIIESLNQYEEKNLNIKLWNRFWQAIRMYNEGSTYEQVLQTLFGAKSSSKVLTHKKNKNFNSTF
jgi:hypothetical protein